MNRLCIVAVAAGALIAAPRQGLKPRASASGYPATATGASVTVGALLLSPDQVRSRFSTDLNRGYVVIEVGVYPKDGARIDLGPGDFELSVPGEEAAIRPAGPKAIAGVLQKSSGGGREITLYPSVGVGYESGRGYDGVRRGGWSTATGVGVGIGGTQPPASTEADRRTMEAELSEQQLPEEIVTAPVAGYLYFPLEAKQKDGPMELEYRSPEGKLVLRLEPPARKTK